MYKSLSYPHQKSFLPNIRNSNQGKSNIYQTFTLCLILCRYFICMMSLDLEHLQRTHEVSIIPVLQKRKQTQWIYVCCFNLGFKAVLTPSFSLTQNIIRPLKFPSTSSVSLCAMLPISLPKTQFQPLIHCLKFLWLYTWLQIKYKVSRTSTQWSKPLSLYRI